MAKPCLGFTQGRCGKTRLAGTVRCDSAWLMDRNALARNLAASLTTGAWDQVTLSAVLHRRLPPALTGYADALAQDALALCPSPYAPQMTGLAAAIGGSLAFEAVWKYCQKKDIWPNPDLTAPVMAPVSAFGACHVPALTTSVALADFLLIEPGRLSYLADPTGRHERHGDMAVNHYHSRIVPKRRGGQRLIEAPKQALKAVQRQLLDGLLSRVPIHDAAFGFVPGRSCLDAAQRHAGEAMVISFDLADYFARIGWGRVFGLFRRLGYPAAVSRDLAGLCTTHTPPRILNRLPPQVRRHLQAAHLPQGAPCSPYLANIVSHGLDTRLAGLARHLGARYTRYADDLTFSGDATIGAPLCRAVPQIVREAGFALNPAKTRVMPAHQRQSVTGVTVNQRLNTTRADFDRLKAVIHACADPSDQRLRDPIFCARLTGQIGWVRMVNPTRGDKLETLLDRALARRRTHNTPNT